MRPQAEWGRGWHAKRIGDFPKCINKTKILYCCKMNFYSAKYEDTAGSPEDKIIVQIFSELANYLCVLFKIQMD